MKPLSPLEQCLRAPLPDVVSLGTMIMDPVWAQTLHRNKSCELIHIIRGSLTLRTPRVSIRSEAGDVLLVPSGTLHRDDFSRHSGLEIFMAFFLWKPEAVYFKAVDFRKLPTMPVHDKMEIAQVIGQIKSDMASGKESDRHLIRARLLTILLQIFRAQKAALPPDRSGSARRQWLMQQARSYIDTHYAGEISLERVASALKISPFYLSHIFSLESEMSLSAYLTSVRMHKAQELLRQGQANVSETAYAVGYADSHYFTRVYRRYFGAPPKAAKGRPRS